jgi:hypothetical protein
MTSTITATATATAALAQKSGFPRAKCLDGSESHAAWAALRNAVAEQDPDALDEVGGVVVSADVDGWRDGVRIVGV